MTKFTDSVPVRADHQILFKQVDSHFRKRKIMETDKGTVNLKCLCLLYQQMDGDVFLQKVLKDNYVEVDMSDVIRKQSV